MLVPAMDSGLPANVLAPRAKVVSVSIEHGGHRIRISDAFGLDDTLIVELEEGDLLRLHAAAHTERQPIGLFIGGWYLQGIPARPEPGVADTLRFPLIRNDENKEVWSRLLGRRFLVSSEPVLITVGTPNGSMVASSDIRRHLQLMGNTDAVGLGMAILIVIGVIGYLALRTPILRESTLYLPNGELAAYSLGRSQMAFWFANAVIAYLAIWAVTGAIPSITMSVLTLMGIGAATALGARMIDEGKSSKRAEDLTQPHEPVFKPSRNLLYDLLHEHNHGNYSLPRLQMVVWTGVMFFVFWNCVLHTLAMPDFDGPTLAMMGISSGTYLGFKIPEK